MKRSVRKNKRQQQAANSAWIKNIGTATKHTKSPLSGMNGLKNSPRSPPQKTWNKYSTSAFAPADSCSACGRYICAETPVLLSAANGAHIQPRDLSRDFARVLGAASSIFPFFWPGADNFRRRASCKSRTRCAAVQTRGTKLLKRKHNRMLRFYSCLISLGMFAGAMLNLFYVMGINQLPECPLLRFWDFRMNLTRQLN